MSQSVTFIGDAQKFLFLHDLHDRKHRRVGSLFAIREPFQHLTNRCWTVFPQNTQYLKFELRRFDELDLLLRHNDPPVQDVLQAQYLLPEQ